MRRTYVRDEAKAGVQPAVQVGVDRAEGGGREREFAFAGAEDQAHAAMRLAASLASAGDRGAAAAGPSGAGGGAAARCGAAEEPGGGRAEDRRAGAGGG